MKKVFVPFVLLAIACSISATKHEAVKAYPEKKTGVKADPNGLIIVIDQCNTYDIGAIDIGGVPVFDLEGTFPITQCNDVGCETGMLGNYQLASVTVENFPYDGKTHYLEIVDSSGGVNIMEIYGDGDYTCYIDVDAHNNVRILTV